MRLSFCAACGSTEDLEHHHLVTRGEQGSDDERNLITLCFACHLKLYERPLRAIANAVGEASRSAMRERRGAMSACR